MSVYQWRHPRIEDLKKNVNLDIFYSITIDFSNNEAKYSSKHASRNGSYYVKLTSNADDNGFMQTLEEVSSMIGGTISDNDRYHGLQITYISLKGCVDIQPKDLVKSYQEKFRDVSVSEITFRNPFGDLPVKESKPIDISSITAVI